MPTLLKERYHIVERLSTNLYLVEDQESGTCRVLKELVPADCLDDNDLASRHRELNSALPMITALQHPNLARIYDHFYRDRRIYVVMEYVWGKSLDRLLAGEAVTRLEAADLATQVCRALHALHDRPRPFFFGSLEPAHVMVTREGDVKLVSFGLSRFFASHLPPLGLAEEYRDLANLLEALPGCSGWEDLIGELRSGRPRYNFAELAHLLSATEPEPKKDRRRERPALWLRFTRNLWAGLRTS